LQKCHIMKLHVKQSIVLLSLAIWVTGFTSPVTNKDYKQAVSKNEITHPAWSRNQTVYELNIRQFTKAGTFKAIEPRLKQLKDMGVGIIWLMPINPIGKKNRKEPLGSYYSVQNYLKVNPNYGTLSDFKHLVASIHKMGMHVIIDWVANHTSWDNVLTKTHPEWYKHDKKGNFVSPVKDWTDVIALNYKKTGLRHYMINAMKYWVQITNIDGFRCDVAGMVPIDFWVEARKQLDQVKPVFMLAEAESPKMHKAFDMTYSWNLYHLFNDIAKGKKKATAIDSVLDNEQAAYPSDAYRMRFTSNHDENSWNGTVFERLGKGAKAFAVLTFTVKGVPLVYDGQEAGMHKRLKFFQKDPINWNNNKGHYRKFYSRLIHLKNSNKALLSGDKGGKMIPLTNSKPQYVYSFVRHKDGQKVFVITNLSGDTQNITLRSKELSGTYYDLFNGKKATFSNNQRMTLKPWDYKVFTNSSDYSTLSN